MKGNRSRDTLPELRVRRAVHRLGLRYRVDTRPIPSLNRRADLVFTRTKVAVFVDGCYWHGCPEHGTSARTNAGYWVAKIEQNRQRDQETNLILAEAGWVVIRAWEHEDSELVASRIADTVRARSY